MISFPICKINLGLHITAKRSDGYHNLETIFFPIPLHDCLEIIQRTENSHQGIRDDHENQYQSPVFKHPSVTFSSSGLIIAGIEDDNLCIKAYQLLKKDFPQLPSIKMHLHKTIPMGAGLGGGSADGAFTLQLLNKKFNLHVSTEQLTKYALQLGSDCPFFIINKPCYATSRGEVLTPIELHLSNYRLLIVNPGIHISTGWAFSNIIPQQPEHSLLDIIRLPVHRWKDLLSNDFEKPVLQQYPELDVLKEKLYEAGASYASMSGSGSTFYALFQHKIPETLSFSSHYFVKQIHHL